MEKKKLKIQFLLRKKSKKKSNLYNKLASSFYQGKESVYYVLFHVPKKWGSLKFDVIKSRIIC